MRRGSNIIASRLLRPDQRPLLRRGIIRCIGWLMACLSLAACRGPAPPPSEETRPAADAPAATPPLLVEAARRLGLDFVHDCGPARTYYMPEIMGPGCGLLDYDDDGDLDVYLVNGGYPPDAPTPPGPVPVNRLFRQEADGSFTDVTVASGLGDPGYGMGVAVADYDNDGFVDVFVTNYGANALYRNRGDGTFRNVTERAGVGDTAWGTSAAFVDYDRDGHLDLIVVNYVQLDPELVCSDAVGRREYCGPERFPGAPDRLYRNRGDGTFTDVSSRSGIGAVGRRGLGVVCGDLTGDGLVDLYVANDNQPNQLWVNQGGGRFRDDAMFMGLAFNQDGQTEASMGVLCEDLDADGDLDLFMTHLKGESNTLYRNEGDGVFEDATATHGLLGPSMPFTGFGVGAVDLEHDGDLDLVMVNGHVFRGSPAAPAADDAADFWSAYAQPGQVYRGEGGGRYTDVSRVVGPFGSEPWVGRGLALGDVDGDGDLDVLTMECNGPARLFLNEHPDQGHWLIVAARDGALRRHAIGATIVVHAAGRRWVRLVNPASSYLSSHDPRAHFGVGDATAIDAIEVTWPDGGRERFPGGAPDRMITLVRGEGETVE